MKTFASILNLLSAEYQVISAFENQSRVELTASCQKVNSPSKPNLTDALRIVSDRDNLTLDVTVGAGDPVTLYTQALKINEFVTNLLQEISDQEEVSNNKIKITIHKSIQNDILSVYDTDAFVGYIMKLPFDELLEFLQVVTASGYISFQTWDTQFKFKTRNIEFTTSPTGDASSIESMKQSRRDRLDRITSVCHYANISQYPFIPEDFKPEIKSQLPTFNKLFEKLSMLFSIVSLFDITSINKTALYYKLNGFRSIAGTVEFNDLAVSSVHEYYAIYNWTYEGGNLSDKIGLIRNIISIHVRDQRVDTLKDSPFNSIKSGYEVYLKQNIKQYIEVRNKITDQLVEFNKKANAIVDEFAKNFKTSVLTFLSFFASVFVLRVLGKGDFNNILTLEAAILSLGFLSITLIYLLFSRWEIEKQKQRLNSGYQNLKLRYQDLLIPGDIERILNNDKDHSDDMAFIDEKRAKYTQMWSLCLILFFTIISLLFYIGNKALVNSLL